MNNLEELGSISEHGNFSDSTKVDTRTEGEDDTDVEEVRFLPLQGTLALL